MDVLFGNKEVTARPHLRLASKLNRSQTLAIRTLAQHGMVVNFIGTVEGKPQSGCTQGEQGLQQLAPVVSLCQGYAGRWHRIFSNLPEIMEELHYL